MRKNTTIGYQLKALGENAIPSGISLPIGNFRLIRVFKHDFFAATALYQLQADSSDPSVPKKIILKLSRQADLFGVPMRWFGHKMTQQEWKTLNRLQGIGGVPKHLELFGREGLIYEFIEGVSLDQKPAAVPDNFFEQLGTLLADIHRRDIAYLDLNKRGNIILRPDGSPALIDFQIAVYIPTHWPLLGRFFKTILKMLQKEDFYHIRKHKRRFCPKLMSESEIAHSRQRSIWGLLHRVLTGPYRVIRRKTLGYLFRKGLLVDGQVEIASPEHDPTRWADK